MPDDPRAIWDLSLLGRLPVGLVAAIEMHGVLDDVTNCLGPPNLLSAFALPAAGEG